jgi:hypothetical protein
MTDFTTYKTSTGVITSCGSTNLPLNEIAKDSDESLIEGIYEAETYKIISGSAVLQNIDWKIGLRFERNALLTESDWTQTADSPLSDSKKAEWVTYRQALRDLPSSYTDDDEYSDVVFPTPPS